MVLRAQFSDIFQRLRGIVHSMTILSSPWDALVVSSSGTATLCAMGSAVAFGYDSTTNERGFLVKMINRTGEASVKGTLISASQSADREAIKQANEFDTIGIIQEAGIAEGAGMWVWVSGSICQVLAKNSTVFTRGNILIAADTDGRANNIANPGSGLPATETHFKECGHVIESKDAGTNVLVLCSIHFN